MDYTHVMDFADENASESVPVRDLGDGDFLVVGVPTFTDLAAFGDIVRGAPGHGGRLAFEGVKSSQGFSTIGLVIDPRRTGCARAIRDIESLGCIVAFKNDVLATVAVPRKAAKNALGLIEHHAKRRHWIARRILWRAP